MKNTYQNDMEQDLQILEKIKKVDAPPFLYTRIEQRISDFNQNYIGTKTLVASFAVLSILIVINISVVFTSLDKKEKNNAGILIENMQLFNSNMLYE